MPATEDTWRNIKWMHVVFAVSGVAMLVATVWMLASDHAREWKQYQRKFRDIETWYASARVDEAQSVSFANQHEELADELMAVQSQAPDAELIARFKTLVSEGPSPDDLDPKELDERQAEAEQAAAEAQAARTKAEQAQETLAAAKEQVATAREAWRVADEDPAATDETIAAAAKALADAEAARDEAAEAARAATREAAEAVQRSAAARDEVFATMRNAIGRARFREDQLTQQTKDARAAFDVRRANFEMAVGNSAGPERLKNLQADADQADQEVGRVTSDLQTARAYREGLERTTMRAAEEEVAARKALDDHQLEVARLQKAVEERAPNLRKRALELPVLDAFNGPLEVKQVWLPQLTLNNNFEDVARFDRCITCHEGIDRPAYEPEQTLASVVLETPDEAPEFDENTSAAQQLRETYGLTLGGEGLLSATDVMVRVVDPLTPAAEAGLQLGDVIEEIGGVSMTSAEQAQVYLLERVEWGSPQTLRVRRGLPHPYSRHPRLDLFLGSTSPHPMQGFGCTICHQGQGSATTFKWASHTPSTLREAEEWATDHGWFNNHHWILPMYPERFAESGCLKCHHEVTELKASQKWPEAPAPKLTEGYELIQHYGCFGCHEINGFDGPERRIGPDLRLEPNYFAAAQQLLADPNLEDLGNSATRWANRLASDPTDEQARRRLRELIVTDSRQEEPVLTGESHKLESALKDAEAPGDMRKVGPSLRHVASKLDFTFLYDWIRNPRDFRPNTRMPKFFGLWDHLHEAKTDEHGHPVRDAEGNVVLAGGRGLHAAQRYEPVEIRAIAEFLLASSQPFEYLNTPGGEPYQYDAEAASADTAALERGKAVFQLRGCLACHQHVDFPEAKASQGPDLSRIGAKLELHERGPQWLYSWVKDPTRYHTRTLMPDMYLEPIEGADGESTDPAADVTAYLMTSQRGIGGGVASSEQQDWQPVPPYPQEADPWAMTSGEAEALRELALEHLIAKYPESRAKSILESGIPQEQADTVRGDEVELLGITPENRAEKILNYVGRRSVSKYGCYGCHDIPGYEDAKPIGTTLADWGRKDPSRLAFEQISHYLSAHGGSFAEGAVPPAGPHSHQAVADARQVASTAMESPVAASSPEERASVQYFLEKVNHHEREGFLWQKLREPRSYDYKKAETVQRYNDRLRMPQFPLDQQQIEAISTFVLGLVAEPPAGQYIYQPDPRQEAIVQGRKVLERFNCAGCHTLEMDRWQINYHEDDFDEAPEITTELDLDPSAPVKTYSTVLPHFTEEQIAQSLKTDNRGLRQAQLVGLPILDPETGSPLRLDEDRQPIEPDDTETPGFYQMMMFEDTLINGEPRLVGLQNLVVPENRITAMQPAWGGDLARLLFPAVVADERTRNPNVNANEAWGWLPPPLAGEGRKVQTQWLHSFLLDPYRIRPAAVLRMPKFNMSSDEAARLVNYFAAADGVDYPYEFDARTRDEHLAEAETEHPGHLQDAMSIVTNNNYCVKCHLVGDYRPPGSEKALAPNLSQVQNRLRPEYVHPWIAFPQRFLPYTGMPVNIPVDTAPSAPARQIYENAEPEQIVAALTDLLMNFGRFAQSNYNVQVEAPPTGETETPATDGQPATGEAPAPEGEGAAPASGEGPPAGETPATGSNANGNAAASPAAP